MSNTGIFGEGLPYSNFHDLNMDWIIKITKDFLDQYTHIQEIIEQGKTDIQDLTTSGIEQIGELTESSLDQLQEKADTLEELLQEWYNTHSEDIANALANALSDLNTWYLNHISLLDNYVSSAIASFNQQAEAKAAETIASIPDDYTELFNSVEELTSSLTEEIIGNANKWENGFIISTSGAKTSSTSRIVTKDFIDPTIYRISIASGYKYVLCAYNKDGSWAGKWNGSALVTSEVWLTDPVNLFEVGNYNFKVYITFTTEADMDPSYASNVHFDIVRPSYDVELLSNALSTTENGKAENFQIGGIVSSSGAPISNSARIRSIGYINNTIYKIHVGAGYQFALCAYEDDDTYVGEWNGTSLAKSQTLLTGDVNLLEIGKYNYKIMLKRTDDADMTESEAENITYTLILSLEYIPQSRGFLQELLYTSLSECRDAGWYGCSSSYKANITDLPANSGSGAFTLFVYPYCYGGTTNYIIQDYINVSGDTFRRTIYNETILYNWKQITYTPQEPDIVKWLAIGDSITEGYYSYFNDLHQGIVARNPLKCYASKLATIKGWTLTNVAEGGSGYLSDGQGNAHNGKWIANNTDFSNYDLITICYGVNDWKYSMNIGDISNDKTANTIYGAIKYVIETIQEANQSAKIVVISPVNCLRGSYATNYGIDYAYPNSGTLQDVCDAIKSVCEYYGIEYIDMLHTSIVNRQNIANMLPDSVHPAEIAHTQMARQLANAIQYSVK